MLKQAAEFIKECKPASIAIVYHKACGDGIAAAAIVARTIEKLKGKLPKIISYAYNEDFKKLSKELSKYKFAIFVDLAIDRNKDELITLSKSAKVLIVDHHELTNNLNKFGILHVHPKFFWQGNSSKYVGAKLAYDICAEVADISDMCWLAGVGLVHDVGSEDFKEFMNQIYRKFPELKEGKNIYGFESRLGQIVSVITAASYGPQAEKSAVKLCIEAKDPMAILESKYAEARLLMHLKADINKEINYYVKNWRTKAKMFKDINLALYRINSKHNIGSAVSTILSLKNPEVIFVVYKKIGSIIKISTRNQTKRINCDELTKKLAANLTNGVGGGHIPAAGSSFAAKDLKKFLELVPKFVKEMLK
ncbi:MAG: DHH family phosphoesterase [DPANN group archaeon]|nr:DHH family phosphoesterase [DPANN group archaeon]